MVFVPSGVLKMGASDEDITGKNETLIRTAQVSGFYMDATEISNYGVSPVYQLGAGFNSPYYPG